MKSTLLTSSMILGSLMTGACGVEGDDPEIAAEAPQEITACGDVKIITARASTEAPGEGITGALVTQIINASDQNVLRVAVSYAATLTNYNSSSLQGINAAKQLLTSEVQACPNEKIVLAGYSQGAHVVTDIIAGGQGGSLGSAVAPVPANVASHVVAIVTFGDPRHVPNQAFDVGTSRRNGLFPRAAGQLQTLGAFGTAKIQAFCDANDTFCDSGFSTATHLTYLNRYQNRAAQFVLGKIGG